MQDTTGDVTAYDRRINHTRGAGSGWSRVEVMMLGVAMVVAAIQFPLIYRINIGWDEFHFLSKVYDYHRGELTDALQTFHVHLFGWIPALGGNEVDQVIAGRAVYYVLLLGSCTSIYLISRRFLSRSGALFAVVLYLSYAEVIGYGTTFRYDGLSVFLLLAALALAVRLPAAAASIAAAAALAAVALMVTIKSLFYFPTLVLVLLIGTADTTWRSNAARTAAFATGSAGIFAILYLLHNAVLPRATVGDSVAFLQRVGPTGIYLNALFPQFGYWFRSMAVNVWTWAYFGAGVAGLLFAARRNESTVRQTVTALALLIPLASLAVYRNAFPYYFVFIMPVAVVVAAVPFDAMVRGGRRERILAVVMLLVVLAGYGVHYRDHTQDEIRAQRQLIEAVHKVFPEPVPYVDPTSLIASFPKVGFFMSTWGVQHYHLEGEPIFRDLLLERKPLFVLANDPIWMKPTGRENPVGGLFPEDLEVLRTNYIHHWGRMYVAGKELAITDSNWAQTRILIPGPYTIEAEEPIVLDDAVLESGDVLTLGQGVVRVRSSNRDQTVRLRWAGLHRPSEQPIDEPIIRGFYPCGAFMSSCTRTTRKGS
jgi:hypothetical protein